MVLFEKNKMEKVKNLKTAKTIEHNLIGSATPGGISFKGDLTPELLSYLEDDCCLIIEYISHGWGYGDANFTKTGVELFEAEAQLKGQMVLVHKKNKGCLDTSCDVFESGDVIMGSLNL